tara:strand:+ start:427 stop:804 length:378 start_codon:yes stop_codon:yes gene_type:complete
MARTTDITGEEVALILEEEKKLLKKERVYLILEIDDRSKETFSMFCLDTTTNNKDGSANICQIMGRSLVDMISNSSDAMYEMGQDLLKEDDEKDSNIISISSHKNFKHKKRVEEDEEDMTGGPDG